MKKLPSACRLVCGIALIAAFFSSAANAQEKASVEKLYQNGERAFRAGQLKEAKRYFRSVLTKLPRHAYSQNYLAKIALMEKKLKGGTLTNAKPLYSFDFVDASPVNSFDIIRKKIKEGGKERLNIVVDPAIEKHPIPVSLRLDKVPALVALRYVAMIVGAEVSERPGAVFIKALNDPEGPLPLVESKRYARILSNNRFSKIELPNVDIVDTLAYLRALAPRVFGGTPLNVVLVQSKCDPAALKRTFDLELNSVAASDVLKFAAELAGLSLVYEDHAVVMCSKDYLPEAEDGVDKGAKAKKVK